MESPLEVRLLEKREREPLLLAARFSFCGLSSTTKEWSVKEEEENVCVGRLVVAVLPLAILDLGPLSRGLLRTSRGERRVDPVDLEKRGAGGGSRRSGSGRDLGPSLVGFWRVEGELAGG